MGSVTYVSSTWHRSWGTDVAAGYTAYVSARSLEPLLGYLRGVGVEVRPAFVVQTPLDRILREYAEYLAQERGLVASTIRGYTDLARGFAKGRFDTKRPRWSQLTPAAIAVFVTRESRRWSIGHCKMKVTCLRSLLRFLHVRGHMTRDLSGCVPAVAGWRLAWLPKALDQDQIDRVLKRRTPGSSKDLGDAAIVRLMVRLGLRWLPDFVAFLESHGSSTITIDLALRWAQQPASADPSWWAKKLGAIRRFARHHHPSDPRTEVPLSDLLPYRRKRQTPYLYTDEGIAALLQEARHLPDSLMSATYATLLGLLAATGMRVSEPLALDEQDIDWHRSLVKVRSSKFGKSRDVPVHCSTIIALHHYRRTRDRLCPRRRASSFFVSHAGKQVLHQNFHHVFLRLVRLARVGERSVRRPRLHDLRHTFALKTVSDWYRKNVDVEQRLPYLSTYLGHVNPSTTYWYLTATPELLALASKKLERSWGALP